VAFRRLPQQLGQGTEVNGEYGKDRLVQLATWGIALRALLAQGADIAALATREGSDRREKVD